MRFLGRTYHRMLKEIGILFPLLDSLCDTTRSFHHKTGSICTNVLQYVLQLITRGCCFRNLQIYIISLYLVLTAMVWCLVWGCCFWSLCCCLLEQIQCSCWSSYWWLVEDCDNVLWFVLLACISTSGNQVKEYIRNETCCSNPDTLYLCRFLAASSKAIKCLLMMLCIWGCVMGDFPPKWGDDVQKIDRSLDHLH